MASSSRNSPSPDPWQPGSIRNVPFGPFLCLLASLATAAAAVCIVFFADGKEVESWMLSPSVFLSILATLGGILLRSAFQAGADTQWWTLLLSRPGVKLRTLHNSWELGHDATSRFKFWSQDSLLILRAAGIVLLLLGANGPLLQRAVFVKLEPAEFLITMDLPIRQEPMWNLTTRLLRHKNYVHSPPPYHDEFAKVVNDLNQRRPLELKSDSCPRESICKATVTIASFSRACVKNSTAIAGAPTLPDYLYIMHMGSEPKRCDTTGSNGTDDVSHCRYLNLEYQLGLQYIDIDTSSIVGRPRPGPGPQELPWLGEDFPPFGIDYTSYFKEDADSDMIAIRRCNFTSAFVLIPIEITQGRILTMSHLTPSELERRNKGEESIPASLWNYHPGPRGFHPLGGLRQTMEDLYAGYMFYDRYTNTNMIGGIGPRQYMNLSTTRHQSQGPNSRTGYSASVIDPVFDFTNTIHELSLRYALQSIPSTAERMQEMKDYYDSRSAEASVADRLEDIRSKMETTASKTQSVQGRETKIVAVYRVDYIYAAIAASLTCLSTILIAFLFTGWRRLGRKFTTSPIEVAKAFEAPLLAAIGSNTKAKDIAKHHGSLRVRYGEKGDPGGDGLLADRSRLSGKRWGTSSVMGYPGPEGYNDSGEVRMRLVVDAAERISPPVKGRTYE